MPSQPDPDPVNALELQACTGATHARAEPFAAVLTDAMAEFEINTPQRQAMFLAQVGHESGGLHWLAELWGPTAVQLRYEGRTDLGNFYRGDGYRYRGRGLIQVTGRFNYRTAGTALGQDLEAHPDMLLLPSLAARSAGWFWQAHQLNELADAGDFDHVCDVVNRGHITDRVGDSTGYALRLALWVAGKEALGVAAAASP